ncbi:response regulator [Candidatus Auribacterota bacterium]
MITSKEMLLLSKKESVASKKKVLIADSNYSSLKKMFEKSDYIPIRANDGEEVLEKSLKYRPNIVIGDFSFSEGKCEDLCLKLKNNGFLKNLPIIMVTTKDTITKRIKTVNGTVDDYIVKPFDSEEILARVERVMSRTEQALDANPLTRLPGNLAIKKTISKKLQNNEKFATCLLDLDNFKAFNDYYGYDQGDKAIGLTSLILMETIQKIKEKNISKDFFVGHIGGDDFVVISPIEEVDFLCSTIIKNFDKQIKLLYDKKDLKKKCINSKDRLGVSQKFPLMTISIAVVSNENQTLSHVGQISQIGTEIKKYIKQFPNSNYLKDRRI